VAGKVYRDGGGVESLEKMVEKEEPSMEPTNDRSRHWQPGMLGQGSRRRSAVERTVEKSSREESRKEQLEMVGRK